MRLGPIELNYPRALLAGLVAVLVVAVAFAGGTSAAAFGSYNPAWDGASQLRAVGENAGAEVTVLTNASEYDAVDPDGTVAVVLSPDRPYTAAERDRLRRFVERGGTLVVAEDFGDHGNALLAGTGSSLRVDGRTLRDEREYYRSPALPVAPTVTDHPLTAGVDRLTLNHGTTVVPASSANASTVAGTNATVLANSSRFSYLDGDGDAELDDDERLRARPVAAVEPVGDGRVVVVSDPSAFINAMLERPNNRRFAAAVFGAHDRVLLDYSHTAGQPPLAALALALRKSSLATALVGAGLLAGVGLWTRRPWTGRSWAGRSLARLPWVGRRGDDRSRSGPGSGPAADHEAPVDEGTYAASLATRHPDWDAAKIRRVMTAVLPRDTEDSEDE
ncbi:DUF4350 domain-containing protein [Halobaculum roseum]|uniref:DUF4350 domain-containing protein n=1 Tax=Halobaculum roseum TaxID=2175149 RepID=A0ABD5MJK3_9EURY|nr:DUF4350 domain-containing protein [Halobaculum roseum]QZY03446.1 DUF4350 domain-containing protein [Halobaculum roseum]